MIINNMHYIKSTFILFMLTFSTCKGQDTLLFDFVKEELEWKKQWISKFFLDYRYYRDTLLVNCYDYDRDIAFDIERKIRVVNRLPLNLVLISLKDFIQKKSIEYDSLVMVYFHSPMYEEEFNYTPVSFGVFHKGEEKQCIVFFFDADLRPYYKLCKHRFFTIFENIKNFQNGCGYGFVTITQFSKDFRKWNIKNIIINPDESID